MRRNDQEGRGNKCSDPERPDHSNRPRSDAVGKMNGARRVHLKRHYLITRDAIPASPASAAFSRPANDIAAADVTESRDLVLSNYV